MISATRARRRDQWLSCAVCVCVVAPWEACSPRCAAPCAWRCGAMWRYVALCGATSCCVAIQVVIWRDVSAAVTHVKNGDMALRRANVALRRATSRYVALRGDGLRCVSLTCLSPLCPRSISMGYDGLDGCADALPLVSGDARETSRAAKRVDGVRAGRYLYFHLSTETRPIASG